MKKYLPIVIFVAVFAAVLAGQIGFKKWSSDAPVADSKYQEYENLFLHSKFTLLDGKELEMTKVKAPVVIFNFWASWCQPCLAEMPSMIELKKKYNDDQLQIIAINTDEEDQKINIQKTMEKIKLTNEFRIVPDTAAKLIEQFKVAAIPVTIIYHRGKVVHFSNGPMDFGSGEFLEKVNGWVGI
jgi:cytochrome c biogenesis protein CcmG, thiol:disulfide interchange protein DsbE